MTGKRFVWTRGRKISAVILVVATSALTMVASLAGGDGMVYYRTPTEIVHNDVVASESVRVGGLVLAGSIEQSDAESTLLLSDGATQITVVYQGRFPAIVQEGQGAVIEGTWRSDGVLLGEELLLRHSNEYRAPAEGTL
ncbi:cytochrome c maturation protein CcmE domain-containing protein [Arthrobacter tumbae]|uniref:cytochrome c maturation protein CcmE domain-containing protein n=1 Tax=Arthrobacter tumbae TaxID=163874 RepID=UPI001956348C|nr:cytochrome c maturation protein CcmE [Arthrobacter tumbae]MBM7781626.1 cytochrome c-type biogenesis protein CcmE [Arthrobacter tumbae]